MSLYIPPECQEFLRVCTSGEMSNASFFSGVFVTLVFGFILYHMFKKCKRKVRDKK